MGSRLSFFPTRLLGRFGSATISLFEDLLSAEDRGKSGICRRFHPLTPPSPSPQAIAARGTVNPQGYILSPQSPIPHTLYLTILPLLPLYPLFPFSPRYRREFGTRVGLQRTPDSRLTAPNATPTPQPYRYSPRPHPGLLCRVHPEIGQIQIDRRPAFPLVDSTS